MKSVSVLTASLTKVGRDEGWRLMIDDFSPDYLQQPNFRTALVLGVHGPDIEESAKPASLPQYAFSAFLCLFLRCLSLPPHYFARLSLSTSHAPVGPLSLILFCPLTRCVALYDHDAKVQQGFNLVGFRKGVYAWHSHLFSPSYSRMETSLL